MTWLVLLGCYLIGAFVSTRVWGKDMRKVSFNGMVLSPKQADLMVALASIWWPVGLLSGLLGAVNARIILWAYPNEQVRPISGPVAGPGPRPLTRDEASSLLPAKMCCALCQKTRDQDRRVGMISLCELCMHERTPEILKRMH